MLCRLVFVHKTQKGWSSITGHCLMVMLVQEQQWWLPDFYTNTLWSSSKVYWKSCLTWRLFPQLYWVMNPVTTHPHAHIGPSPGLHPYVGPLVHLAPPAPLLHGSLWRRRSIMKALWLVPWRMPSRIWWGPTLCSYHRITECGLSYISFPVPMVLDRREWKSCIK